MWYKFSLHSHLNLGLHAVLYPQYLPKDSREWEYVESHHGDPKYPESVGQGGVKVQESLERRLRAKSAFKIGPV